MTERAEGYHAALASRTRRRVLEALLDSPAPLDAAAIASGLGLHVTTARFHLDQLKAAGLVRRSTDPEHRRGRPRVLYGPAGTPRDEGARARLIEVLATAMAGGESGTAGSLRAGRRWAEDFDPPDRADPVPGLVEVLDRLGFEPEPRAGSEDAGELLLRGCPFRSAARAHPEVVCTVHRGLLDGLLEGAGRGGRLLPFVEPELCVVALET